MIDIKLVRENPDVIRKNLQKRDMPKKLKELDELIETDNRWRAALQETEQLKKQRNILSKEINELKKAGKDASKKLNLVKNIPKKIRGKSK